MDGNVPHKSGFAGLRVCGSAGLRVSNPQTRRPADPQTRRPADPLRVCEISIFACGDLLAEIFDTVV